MENLNNPAGRPSMPVSSELASVLAEVTANKWIAQSTLPPTQETYTALQEAYRIYNIELFGGILPDCLITLQRHAGTNGYFCGERFVNESGTLTDEIALNPMYFAERGDLGVLSTQAHEMAHLWRFRFGRRNRKGEPGRQGYHCREWGKQMKEIGLQPSHTGRPGGRQVGYQMTHYIIDGGPFEIVTKNIIRNGFKLSWADNEKLGKAEPPVIGSPTTDDKDKSNRWKYVCPNCGESVWGRPNAHVGCWDCLVQMPRGMPRRRRK